MSVPVTPVRLLKSVKILRDLITVNVKLAIIEEIQRKTAKVS